VEKAVALGQHEVAVALAERALDAAPESISLSLMLANVHANRGEFVPARLEALCPREMPVGLRRRLHANLGVALLAVGRVAEGLEALRRAAADAATWMSPDSPVGWAAEPALIQPMRQLLQLDGTGERAASWGVGGLRMVVLLDGLAGATVDPQHAELLRTEAETRQRAIFEHFAADPDEPHVTLAEVVEDAADYARVLSLEATAARLSALR
jgi:tetratricopeptide (TPR) repeat protein